MGIRKGICLGAAICFLIAGFSPSLGAAGQRSAQKEALQKAPPFRLKGLEGKEVRLENYAGKVILLDFWATWCPPCQDEIPDLIDVYNQYRERGFVILGVASGDDPSAVRDFVKKKRVSYPILLGDETIFAAYRGVYFLPTAFLIDRKGYIRQKMVGPKDKETLEQKIGPLLEAP